MSDEGAQKQCIETLQMMQCGALDLNQIIEYGILLLGKTKAGKTTTSHYLTHQVLQGGYNDQNYVVYKMKQVDRKYNSAKIGDSENKSQTRIPNVFEFSDGVGDPNQKSYLIDCPGYIDTFGYYRIISNRFFHYQVFSKVKNTKFVITLTFSDLRKSADNVKETFREFLSGFSNLENIKQQIFDATSVVVTNVQKGTTLDAVMSSYSKTPSWIGDEEINMIYAELQKQIVEKRRLYIFQGAQLGKMCNIENTMLKDINANTKFWKRQLVHPNEVDMSNISLTLTKYIEKNKSSFAKQMKKFGQFYEEEIESSFTSFKQILKQFVKDVETGQEGYKFMQQIFSETQKKMKKREENQDYKFLYDKYKTKRQKIQQYLFMTKQASQSVINTISDLPFWASKYITFQQIEKIVSQTQQDNKKSRTDDNQLIQFSVIIMKMVKLILALSKSKKLPQKQEKLKQKYFIEYAYELYKNIQISNKIFMMSYVSKSENVPALAQFLETGMTFILVKYPTVVRALILKSIQTKSVELLPIILEKVQINAGLTKRASDCIVNMFESYQKAIDHDKQIQQSKKQDLKRKINDKIFKVRNNSLDLFLRQQNPDLKSLIQMQNHRKKIYQQIKQCRQNAYENENLLIENNKIIMLMAECLQKNQRLDLAKQLYDQIFNGHKVLQIFQLQQTQKRRSRNRQDYLQHLMKYMQAARKYRRCEVALVKAQEAYHCAMYESKKKEVTFILSFIKDISKGGCCRNVNDAYTQFLFQEVPDVDLPKELLKKIDDQARKTEKITKEVKNKQSSPNPKTVKKTSEDQLKNGLVPGM